MPHGSNDAADAVPSAVREILALYAGTLHDQRFGDLDAAALEAMAERVRAAAEEVDRARAALDDAQEALADARDALSRRAQQALAYARVYAAGDEGACDEALSTRLAALEGPEVAPRERTRRRVPKKARARGGAELPFEPPTESRAHALGA